MSSLKMRRRDFIRGLAATALLPGLARATVLNPVRAFRCGPLGCIEASVGAATGADNLPSGNIVAQGTYNVFGASVAMTGEGLYRVADFAGRSVQVLVFGGDVETLISAIGWMSQTGYTDGVTYTSAFQTAVRSRNLSTSCGATAGLAQTLMAQCGIMTRSVGGLATGLPLNSYDNGHTIMEYWNGVKWIAVDFLMKLRFKNAAGDLLNMLEMHTLVFSGGTLYVEGFGPPIGGADAGSNPYLWLQQAILTNPTAWFAKSFQIPYIQNGYAYQAMYENASQQALILSGDIGTLQALSRASFEATFYGKTMFGEPPHPTTKAGWGALTTMFDPGLFILPGSTITSLGAVLDTAQSVEFKVLQKVSGNTWKTVANYPFSHPGGGNAGPSISFAHPGGLCVPAIAANPPVAEAFSVIGVRDYVGGSLAVNAQAAFGRATSGAICLRYAVS